jgi:hypothetical protein
MQARSAALNECANPDNNQSEKYKGGGDELASWKVVARKELVIHSVLQSGTYRGSKTLTVKNFRSNVRPRFLSLIGATDERCSELLILDPNPWNCGERVTIAHGSGLMERRSAVCTIEQSGHR